MARARRPSERTTPTPPATRFPTKKIEVEYIDMDELGDFEGRAFRTTSGELTLFMSCGDEHTVRIDRLQAFALAVADLPVIDRAIAVGV